MQETRNGRAFTMTVMTASPGYTVSVASNDTELTADAVMIADAPAGSDPDRGDTVRLPCRPGGTSIVYALTGPPVAEITNVFVEASPAFETSTSCDCPTTMTPGAVAGATTTTTGGDARG